MERYKFKCACPVCSDDSTDRDQSRKKVIAASFKERSREESMLLQWVCDQTKPVDFIIKQCLEMINIVVQERLFHGQVWPVWYQRLVKVCHRRRQKCCEMGT